MDYETMYGRLITEALPGVSFPRDYDFEAEFKNDIKRVRAQAQVDVTVECETLRCQLEEEKVKDGGPIDSRVMVLETKLEAIDSKLALISSLMSHTIGTI